MNSKVVLRDAIVDMVVEAARPAIEAACRQIAIPGGVHRTCLTCVSFDRQNELCNKHRDWGRPPARVIAYGCDEYFDDETIPF